MKVFISSLIIGLEEYRAAAREAVEALGYEAVMAENFRAKAQSPQVACLDELRQSGLVLLLLGADYGMKQKGGLSATHEEYRDARGNRPVMAFVRADITPDSDQATFIKEVQGWESGLFRGSFSSPNDLRAAIIGAIHAWQLTNATGPLDPKALSVAAVDTVRTALKEHRHSDPSLVLAVSVGPTQSILRPSDIEKPKLSKDLLQEALFGEFPIFSHAHGNEEAVESNRLVIQQASGARIVKLDAAGNLLFWLALEKNNGLFAIIKETLEQQVMHALKYAAAVLERIDPTQKLTHVALAASLAGADYTVIRTQAEHNASPNSCQIGRVWGQEEDGSVQLQPAHRPRAALFYEAEVLAEDLVTLLRGKGSGSATKLR